MKNKKGNLHIDWVISIGIFLTYIILLITLIKPSYEPSFEGGVLVNLAKEKFYDDLVGYEAAPDPGAKTEGMKCENPHEFNIGAGNPIIFKGLSEDRLDNL